MLLHQKQMHFTPNTFCTRSPLAIFYHLLPMFFYEANAFYTKIIYIFFTPKKLQEGTFTWLLHHWLFAQKTLLTTSLWHQNIGRHTCKKRFTNHMIWLQPFSLKCRIGNRAILYWERLREVTLRTIQDYHINANLYDEWLHSSSLFASCVRPCINYAIQKVPMSTGMKNEKARHTPAPTTFQRGKLSPKRSPILTWHDLPDTVNAFLHVYYFTYVKLIYNVCMQHFGHHHQVSPWQCCLSAVLFDLHGWYPQKYHRIPIRQTAPLLVPGFCTHA